MDLVIIVFKFEIVQGLDQFVHVLSDEVLMVPLDWVLGMLYWIICFSSPRKARQGMVLYELIF